MPPAPVRMPWTGALVPHATLEVNAACNVDCDGCYKDKRGPDKPLAQIEREIDFLVARRRLTVLTIAGGEPTLHPDLPAVIAAVARRGVRPMLLTNGTLLDDARLTAYRAAGLGRVALHIDSRQRGRPDAPPAVSEAVLTPLRRTLAERCAAHGLDVTLVVTLYRDTLGGLRDVVDLVLGCPSISALLATGYSERIDRRRQGTAGAGVGNQAVADTMAEIYRAHPVWFIPSERQDGSRRWLFYQAGVTLDPAGRVETLWWHPRNRLSLALLPRLDRLARGRFHFDPPMTATDRATLMGLYAGLSGHPRTVAETARFLARAARHGNLKTLSLVFQEGPAPLPDGGFDACRDCPDATCRDGRLVPICLADHER